MSTVPVFGLYSKGRVYLQLGQANPLRIKAMTETFKTCCLLWNTIIHQHRKAGKKLIKCLKGYTVTAQQEEDFLQKGTFMQLLKFCLSIEVV